MLGVLGIEDIKKVFDLNWYSTQNFHGQYYLDSDILNDFLDFRREGFEDFLKRLKANLKFPSTFLKYLPDFLIKNLVMEPLAKNKGGTLNWINNYDDKRIEAFFGSRREYEEIGDWKNFSIDEDYDQVKILNHGYDENKDKSLLDIEDMREAANYRGGKCLSKSMEKGNLDAKLRWRCAFSHEFEASPRLVLLTGHWCEKCEPPPWRHREIAKKNPFFAQIV